MRELTLLLIFASVASANWGGDGGGSVGTGAFRTFGTGQIEMQREDLTIELHHSYADVEVRYVLKNTGGPVDVKAGFPSLELSGKEKTYYGVYNYHLTANGSEIPHHAEKGELGNWKNYFDPDYVGMALGPGDGQESQYAIWWLASTVHFDQGESKQIRITYDSNYEFAEGGPSGDEYHKPDIFRYLLSPASTWKGPIQQGKVTIKGITVDAKTVLVKPAGRFKLSGKDLVWEFTNLKPTLADNFEVSMNNEFKTVLLRGPESKETSWYSMEGKKWFFDFHDYKARASSTAKGYDAQSVGDLMNDTAWVAGANGGINESLTLTLDKPTHVDQIGIVPGYAKTHELYFANSRVRELEVRVNNNPPITAELPDEFLGYGLSSYKGYDLVSLGAYAGDAKTITLTVKKTYPGSKYNDLCISEILLRKRFTKEPQVSGAR